MVYFFTLGISGLLVLHIGNEGMIHVIITNDNPSNPPATHPFPAWNAPVRLISGWWFGCHEFYFPIHIGNLIIPIDELIFSRGVAKNHQPDMYLFIYNAINGLMGYWDDWDDYVLWHGELNLGFRGWFKVWFFFMWSPDFFWDPPVVWGNYWLTFMFIYIYTYMYIHICFMGSSKINLS